MSAFVPFVSGARPSMATFMVSAPNLVHETCHKPANKGHCMHWVRAKADAPYVMMLGCEIVRTHAISIRMIAHFAKAALPMHGCMNPWSTIGADERLRIRDSMPAQEPQVVGPQGPRFETHTFQIEEIEAELKDMLSAETMRVYVRDTHNQCVRLYWYTLNARLDVAERSRLIADPSELVCAMDQGHTVCMSLCGYNRLVYYERVGEFYIRCTVIKRTHA